MPTRDTVLFLCVANSARSQMAEGLARASAPADLRIASAGSSPATVNPLARQALAELGIDTGDARSKGIAEIDLDRVRAVITLCAEEVCPPLPPFVVHRHWPLPDPAAAEGDEATRLAAFRAVRDELRRRLPEMLALGAEAG